MVAGLAESGELTVVGVSSGVDGFEAIATKAQQLHIDGFAHIADLDGSVWARFGVLRQPASVVVTADGTKYVSSVRHGSVSRIRPGQEAEIIASGIPSAASMCYDSIQHQLVIPLNPNYALAFVRLD